MVTAVVIFGVAYILIVTGRIPQVLIAVLAAMAMAFSGIITEQQALSYVDLEVIPAQGDLCITPDLLRQSRE